MGRFTQGLAKGSSVNVFVFEGSPPGDMYLATLKQSLDRTAMVAPLLGDPKRMQAQMLKQFQAPLSPSTHSPERALSLADLQARQAEQIRLYSGMSHIIAAAHRTQADASGSFCVGVQPGVYDILLGVQRQVQATPALQKMGHPFMNQTMYYVAKHVAVPKPKRAGTQVFVKATHFALMGTRP